MHVVKQYVSHIYTEA